MSQNILLLLEVSGIQEYVFGSNELVQNIGASELVMQTTGEWLFSALDDADLTHNVERRGDGYKFDFDTGQYPLNDRGIVNDRDAEIIYTGGGKALLLFGNEEHKTRFVMNLSERVLLHAPDLQLVVASCPIEWETMALWDVLDTLFGLLEKRKANRPTSMPLLGLGVTAACAFTGLPTVANDPTQDGRERARRISMPVWSKIKARETADARLHALLPQVRKQNLEFVYDFDLLGTADQSSYLAVIHADGNRMGERFGRIAGDFRTASGTIAERNRKYAQALRAFSTTISVASTKALRATVDALLASREDAGGNTQDEKERSFFGGIVPTPSKRKRGQKGEYEYFIPFRPIVFGGDDVTFVCEGRLGLAVAAKYLDVFSSELLSDREYAHARAGIAIVHTHYPFSRAYDLASELCQSAKDFIKKQPSHVTALDWHFAISGLVRGLSEVRAREYHTSEGALTLRPYQLGKMEKDARYSWDTFRSVVNEFSGGQNWKGRRNKLKELRDALRAGPYATEQLLELLADDKPVTLPTIPDRPTMSKRGWQGDECGYFDALEALDFFVPLPERGV